MNEFEQDEHLDLLNPLRHLMDAAEDSDPEHSHNDSNDYDPSSSTPASSSRSKSHHTLIPRQIASILDRTDELVFPEPSLEFPAENTDSEESCNIPQIKVQLYVDASPGCGGVAWPAGRVLSDYLVRRYSNRLEGKTILELGSGTGLVGLVAAKLGGRVWITDQAPLLDIMTRNVRMNDIQEDRIRVAELNWGEPTPQTVPSKPDIILAADCVYFEPAFPLLVQTLSDLAHPETDILFCYKKRRKADKRFFGLLKKKFRYDEIPDDPYSKIYSRDAISLLRLTKISLN